MTTSPDTDQVVIPGGEFLMGSDRHYPEERPSRTVRVDSFRIDASPVTNRRFEEFVNATGYVTFAERPPDPALYPGARPRDLVPGSLLFTMTPGPVDLGNFLNWWAWTPGADWRHPLGPGSSLDGLELHPVVHVAYPDAVAFARWNGMRLPSEAEWEYAARAGLWDTEFEWGDQDTQETAPRANTWQGRFPYENTELDGWIRTSPVGSYQPNGYGLYDMTGNIWEWTSSRYRTVPVMNTNSPCCGARKRYGAAAGEHSGPYPSRVIKGGSHLCTTQYCFRYRPSARQPQTIDTSAGHLGFRCAARDRPRPAGYRRQKDPSGAGRIRPP